MNKIRVSAVSYTNSKPFVYGLTHSAILQQIELTLDNPSECAYKLINRQSDIGLVPVASLLEIPGYEIVSDYCIGASGAVDSVFIFSTRPVGEIRSVLLDPQSRTSNKLAEVLLKNYWQTRPEFLTEGPADACILIGDRTFGKKKQYQYSYDLAAEWYNYTGLPFVFAVWASNIPVPRSFIAAFNSAMELGLEHRSDVIAAISPTENFDLHDYLMNKIDFELDEKKLEALKKFHQLIEDLDD